MVRLSCGWRLVLHLFEKRPSLGLLAVPFVGQHVLSAKALARPPLPGCAVVQLRNSAEWVDSRQKPVCGKRSAIVAPSLDAQSAPAGHDLQLLPSLVWFARRPPLDECPLAWSGARGQPRGTWRKRPRRDVLAA